MRPSKISNPPTRWEVKARVTDRVGASYGEERGREISSRGQITRDLVTWGSMREKRRQVIENGREEWGKSRVSNKARESPSDLQTFIRITHQEKFSLPLPLFSLLSQKKKINPQKCKVGWLGKWDLGGFEERKTYDHYIYKWKKMVTNRNTESHRFNYFPHCCNKMPDQSIWKKKRSILVKVEGEGRSVTEEDKVEGLEDWWSLLHLQLGNKRH